MERLHFSMSLNLSFFLTANSARRFSRISSILGSADVITASSLVLTPFCVSSGLNIFFKFSLMPIEHPKASYQDPMVLLLHGKAEIFDLVLLEEFYA